jgi:hypothetical protein
MCLMVQRFFACINDTPNEPLFRYLTSTVAIDVLDCTLFYPTSNLVSFTLSSLLLQSGPFAYNSLSVSSVSLSEVGWSFLSASGFS